MPSEGKPCPHAPCCPSLRPGVASHFCCTPGPSPAAEPTPRLGVTFLPSLWTLYPVCIMPGLQKTHAHPHSSLCQLCLQSASPNTFLQKTHPYHARLFRSLHTCPCCIPTWFQPGGKQQLPRLLLLARYQACASPGPFVPPLLVRGPGIFLGRSSSPFWTTSVYRIFSEF